MLTEEWPRVGRQPGDRALTRALFSLYAGPCSEWTAAAQYLYLGLRLAAEGREEAAECCACLSEAALGNARRLGQLIVQYGGDPRLLYFSDGTAHWWSGSAVACQAATGVLAAQAVSAGRQRLRQCRALLPRLAARPRALIERLMREEAHQAELVEGLLCAPETGPVTSAERPCSQCSTRS